MQDRTMLKYNASLIDELEAAIAAGTPEKRLIALTRITDLFIAGTGHHSQGVIDLFDDILSSLIATIEVNARAQLSRQLAHCTDSPPNFSMTASASTSATIASATMPAAGTAHTSERW